jgi:ketosteroid isomerase-like protein
MTSDPAMSLQFQASKVDVAKSGDLAYTQGSYTLAITDPQTKKVVNDHGSYVTAYRKQADGSWKAVEDIVVSEIPPPAAPEKAAKHAKAKGGAHRRAKRR